MQSPAYDKEWPPHLESLDQQYELDLPELDGDDEVLLRQLSSALRKRIEKDRAHEMQAIKEKLWVLSCSLQNRLNWQLWAATDRQLNLFLLTYIISNPIVSRQDLERSEQAAIDRLPSRLRTKAIDRLRRVDNHLADEISTSALIQAHLDTPGHGQMPWIVVVCLIGMTLHLTLAISLAFIYIASAASRDPKESSVELMSETIHALVTPVRSYKSMDTHERQKRIDDLFERRYITALLYRKQRPSTASRPISSSHGSVQVDVKEARDAVNFLSSKIHLVKTLAELGLSCICELLEEDMATTDVELEDIRFSTFAEVIRIVDPHANFSPEIQSVLQQIAEDSPVPILYVQDTSSAKNLGSVPTSVDQTASASNEPAFQTGSSHHERGTEALADAAVAQEVDNGLEKVGEFAAYTATYQSRAVEYIARLRIMVRWELDTPPSRFTTICEVDIGKAERTKVEEVEFGYEIVAPVTFPIQRWRECSQLLGADIVVLLKFLIDAHAEMLPRLEQDGERVNSRNRTVNIHLGANPSVDLGLGGQHEVTSSGVGISSCIDSLDLKRAIIKPPHNPSGVSLHHRHALDHTAKQFQFHSYASGKIKRMHQGLFWSRYAVRIQMDFERPIAPGNHSIAVTHPTTDINDILFDPAEQISAQVTLHRNSHYILGSNDPTPRFVLA